MQYQVLRFKFGSEILELMQKKQKMAQNQANWLYSYPKVTYSDPKVTHSDPTHLPLPPPTSSAPHMAISWVKLNLRVVVGGWL